jgi:hypothetical protein
LSKHTKISSNFEILFLNNSDNSSTNFIFIIQYSFCTKPSIDPHLFLNSIHYLINFIIKIINSAINFAAIVKSTLSILLSFDLLEFNYNSNFNSITNFIHIPNLSNYFNLLFLHDFYLFYANQHNFLFNFY